jgi:hypothetical protein
MAQLPHYTSKQNAKKGGRPTRLGEGCKCCQEVQVVCISNQEMSSILIVGKIYEAIDMETQKHVMQTKHYNLISDDGFRDSHKKELFITLAEFRQHRIDEILED